MFFYADEHVSINMIDLYWFICLLSTGLTQVFPIHEDNEDLFPISVSVQEVSHMVDTVLSILTHHQVSILYIFIQENISKNI